MKRKSVFLAFLFTLCTCIILLIPAAATEVIAKGSCEKGITWVLDSDGVLTFSGSGDIASNYDDFNRPPWLANALDIKSVVIKSGITSICEYAFIGCSNLTSVTIPDTVKTIGYEAFKDCTSITSITIPKGVESMGNYVLAGCSSLSSVSLPSTISKISAGTFANCTSLTTFTVPGNIREIGVFAFSMCSKLSSVTLSEGLEVIGHYAFSRCNSLHELTLPSTVRYLDYPIMPHSPIENIHVIEDSPSFTSVDGILFNKNLSSIVCYPSGRTATHYEIPSSVTWICGSAFEGSTYLTSITIPDSVEVIEDYAFWGCTGLTSIVIPQKVSVLKDRTFYNCSSLSSVTLPENLVSIGPSVFDGCSSLPTIEIPDTVTQIGYRAFMDCTSLTTISIPEDVTQIPEETFRACSSLTNVVLPDGISSIGVSAFSECSNLASISLPSTLTSIGQYAFAASGLSSITIPESVTTIGSSAFRGCDNLTSIVLPSSITNIERWTFSDSDNLRLAIIPSSVKTIEDGAFQSCKELRSVVFLGAPENIGNSVFGSCIGLEDVYFAGTESTWSGVNIDDGNYPLQNANAHYLEEPLTTITGCIGTPVEIELTTSSDNHYTLTSENDPCVTMEYVGQDANDTAPDISYAQKYKLDFTKAGKYLLILKQAETNDLILRVADIAADHSYGEWIETKAPTTTEEGIAKRVCSICSHEETKTLPSLVITTYTITPSVTNGTISPAEAVVVNEGGSKRFDFAPNSGYEMDSVKVDGIDVDATTYYTFENVSASHTIDVAFRAIGQSPDLEFVLVNFHVTPNSASIVVKDASGNVVPANQAGEYNLVPGTSYTYTVSASGYVTKSGSFIPSTGNGENQITVNLSVISSGGGSSGGGGGSSSSSGTTTKNPDGSTTTTTTDKATGAVTETTKNTDGSTTTVETKKDGTVTETNKTADGTTGTVVTDKNGDVTEVKATLSSTAAKNAAKTGEAVTLPVEVPSAKTTKAAPAVEITVPKSTGSFKVEIPVEQVTPGTVAVIVKADGAEEIVATSMITEKGVSVKLDGSTTVKVFDNAKSFTDVSATNVFYNEISSLSAREIMIGVSSEKFDLNGNVTLNQIANVAGRITGDVDVKDFNSGIDWGNVNGLKTGGENATRGEVLTALYVAAGSPIVEDTSILNMFGDGANITADMTTITAWAAKNGILKGDLAGMANLSAKVTRGQTCALASRTMSVIS